MVDTLSLTLSTIRFPWIPFFRVLHSILMTWWPVFLFLMFVLYNTCYRIMSPLRQGIETTSHPFFQLLVTLFYIILALMWQKLLINYIESFSLIRDPKFHRNPNLVIGHISAFILVVKYNITFLIHQIVILLPFFTTHSIASMDHKWAPLRV